MSSRVRVLIISDSAEEASAFVEALEDGGYRTAFERVCDRDALESALTPESWDVILCRYELERFDPLAALHAARQSDGDVPFLIISEEIGEETTVRVLKEGVNNCLPLRSLARLAPAVEHELREAQLRRERRLGQKALRDSESRFRTLAQTASDAILTVDEDGIILFANRAAERIFGRPVSALIGDRLETVLPEGPALDRLLHPASDHGRAGERAETAEVIGRHAGNGDIPLEISFGTFTKERRRMVTVIARDATERLRARRLLQESEERFRIAAQSLSDLIYEWDIATGALLVLGDVDQRLGFAPGELPRTLEAWEDRIHPEDRDRVRNSLDRSLATDAPFAEEYRIGRKDGEWLHWSNAGRTIRDAEGKPSRWIGVVTDVTEKRRTEAALKQSDERLRTLVHNAPVILFSVDRAGVFTHIDGRGLNLIRMRPADVVGHSSLELYASFPQIVSAIHRALAGEDFTTTVSAGELSWEICVSARRDALGEPAGAVGVAIDVTEQQKARRAADQSELRYRNLFERNLAGVFRTTTDGRFLDCNESFARIFGYDSREEVLGRPASDFYGAPQDRALTIRRLAERQTLSNYEQCLRRKDGSPVWVLENAALIDGPEGEVIEGTVIDITERKRAEEQVKHLAFHDALTGLPNRLLFQDRLNVAVVQAHRTHQKLAVLFLDIDRFKVINDSLGHSVGDELLRRMADRVAGCVREGDTVARLGGDEFTVLVPGIGQDQDAATIAQKILDAVRLPFWIDQRELFVTTSVGLAVYPADGADAETLVRNADTAMYRAKEQGRDNYQPYAPAMNARALERLSLESRLRQALHNGELVLVYQPLVDLRTGKIRGAEALLRWREPSFGQIAPTEFIPIAELSGLIVPIGEWVLRTACARVRAWHRAGFPHLSIAVNLSSRQLQQSGLLRQVTSALEESGMPASALDLEITETNAMQNAEASISTLGSLKDLGVSLSMDDFGTGYSSLNYLKRFPIDRIKIDQSFVRDVTQDSDAAAIVAAVIAMAHSLQISVVAEGVETDEQLAILRQSACDEMQGYLFSPPVGEREFEELLRADRTLAAISDANALPGRK